MRSSILALTILALTLALTAACDRSDPDPADGDWPTEGWTVSTPEAERLDPAPLAALVQAIESGEHGHIDRLVVVRHGSLVLNRRFDNDYVEISRGHEGALGCGTDACDGTEASHEYNYYHPTTHPYYEGRDVHSLQSVTKSVAATMIGVAIARGAIEDTERPLLGFFGEYDLTKTDERLQEATLDDLLTMRSGIEWHEVGRPLDETNTTLLLERSDDWIAFTLSQPMDAAPGEKWAYNSGGSHLISGVVRDATGEFIDAYAEQWLFRPLGIDDYHWKRTPRGYPDTEGGLYLEAEQLAKIGYLYLNDGVWDGERILPEGWVETATERRVERVNDAWLGLRLPVVAPGSGRRRGLGRARLRRTVPADPSRAGSDWRRQQLERLRCQNDAYPAGVARRTDRGLGTGASAPGKLIAGP